MYTLWLLQKLREEINFEGPNVIHILQAMEPCAHGALQERVSLLLFLAKSGIIHRNKRRFYTLALTITQLTDNPLNAFSPNTLVRITNDTEVLLLYEVLTAYVLLEEKVCEEDKRKLEAAIRSQQ